ncbi:hypothetical protein HDU93_006788, partial [Gonapodya sp. JEL0774]
MVRYLDTPAQVNRDREHEHEVDYDREKGADENGKGLGPKGVGEEAAAVAGVDSGALLDL